MSHSGLMLAAAVTFEVMWAVSLKMSRGFTVLWASLLTEVAYVLSLVFLVLATKQMNISMAYAVWTGSGAAAVAVIGVVVFKEPLGLARAVGLALVVCGVVVLLGMEAPAT